MTPEAGVLFLGCGHVSHYSKNALSSSLSMYSAFMAIVLRDYNAAFLCHCWFFVVDNYANMSPSDKCRVSDTQVTVKVCGPLGFS